MIDRLTRFWRSLSWTSTLLAGLGIVLIGFGVLFFREQLIGWLTRFWQSLSWTTILIGTGLFLISLVVSFAAIGIVMVKIPENYFSSHYQRDFLPESPWLVHWGAVVAKNIAGVILVGIGIILSLPGVPGQGVLTILLGLIMIDLPGKRPLEAKIIQRPAVLSAINRLRAKYERPPLVMD